MITEDINKKRLSLLEKVLKLSAESKLKWEETANKDLFTAKIKDEFGVIIERTRGSSGVITYCLYLRDSDNRDLTRISSSDFGGVSIKLGKDDVRVHIAFVELFSIARNSALKIPERLDSAQKLLDQIEDELPF